MKTRAAYQRRQAPFDPFWFVEEKGLPFGDESTHPLKYSPWSHFRQYSHFPPDVRYIPSSHMTHLPADLSPQLTLRAPTFVAGQFSSQLYEAGRNIGEYTSSEETMHETCDKRSASQPVGTCPSDRHNTHCHPNICLRGTPGQTRAQPTQSK
jgi:hypothetical protein